MRSLPSAPVLRAAARKPDQASSQIRVEIGAAADAIIAKCFGLSGRRQKTRHSEQPDTCGTWRRRGCDNCQALRSFGPPHETHSSEEPDTRGNWRRRGCDHCQVLRPFGPPPGNPTQRAARYAWQLAPPRMRKLPSASVFRAAARKPALASSQIRVALGAAADAIIAKRFGLSGHPMKPTLARSQIRVAIGDDADAIIASCFGLSGRRKESQPSRQPDTRGNWRRRGCDNCQSPGNPTERAARYAR